LVLGSPDIEWQFCPFQLKEFNDKNIINKHLFCLGYVGVGCFSQSVDYMVLLTVHIDLQFFTLNYLLWAEQRDDRRRATHNEVERRRRDKINNWIVKLSKIIPDCTTESAKTGQVGDARVRFQRTILMASFGYSWGVWMWVSFNFVQGTVNDVVV
jgi:hypothetical protein